MEIYAFPMRKEADRIWACLDYIYDVPRNLSREQKGRWIITQIRDKTGVYMNARKARAPANLESFSQQVQRSTAKSTSPTNPPRRSSGGAQFRANESRPAVTARELSYGQPANAPYIPASTPSDQRPPPIAPVSMPPMSDAPMVDIDWVGFLCFYISIILSDSTNPIIARMG